MNAGKLRHRLQLQKPLEATNDSGTVALTDDSQWQTYVTVWGMIEPLGGSEFMNAGQVIAVGTHRITIRGRQPVLTTHRIVYNGRKFAVQSSSDSEERGIMLTIYVKELQ